MIQALSRLKRQLFGPTTVKDDGSPVIYFWVGDDNYSVLMNPTTNRVYATLSHDGYGKIDPTIFVSPFAVPRVYAFDRPYAFSLRTFPLCALAFVRFKQPMWYAQELTERILIELRIITAK